MTSQKRYRHHQQDSNNGNSRFRDLPPRFKRQKSSSSPPPKPLAPPNEENNYSENTSRILVQDMSPITPPVAATATDGLKVLPGLERTNLGLSKSSQIPHSNDSMWTMLPRKEQQPVLSPVDNMHFNNFSSCRQSPPAHIPLGTHFGYSPPMSPWSNTSTAGYPGQTAGIFIQSPWSQSGFDQYSNQRLQSPPTFNLNNENHAPSINLMPQHSPVAPWTKSAFSPQPGVSTTTIQAQRLLSSSSPPILKENTQPIESPKPDIDYSDPDIRTIEMLRELERVADEKDNDDFGVDRKSLVSHHLRMLMCAVDRYTEGVEDELTRREEVFQKTESPVHTPRQNSPAPTISMWTQDPVQKGKNSPKKTENLNWNQNKNASLLWQEQERKDLSTNQQGLKSPTKICNTPVSTPQLQKSLWEEKVRPVQPGTPGWDLWSSPSFDFYGVLGNHGSCDTSNMPFFDFFGNCNRGDLLGAEELKERKPLYKR